MALFLTVLNKKPT